MNFRYPIFLDLTGKKCLVTGQGPEIAAKVRSLVDARAQVVYVNPTAAPEIAELGSSSVIHWEPRDVQPRDLEECFLVITDHDDNSQVFRLAEERNILCNSVDDPEHCRFIFGSLHRQGDLTIAISTNGGAPALAVQLRQKLQRDIGPEYGDLLQLLKEIRLEISSRIADFNARRDLWYCLASSEMLELLRAGQRSLAIRKMRNMIEDAVSNTSLLGTSAEDADR